MRRGGGILRWKGALADGGAALRRTAAGVLALACIAMSFTQLGFLGIGLADGGSVYLVLMLVPVALSAMLLGPLRAQNQLDIAVEELFVNVCHYAYEGMPESVARTVRVTCAYSADPASVTVEIIDAGVPYDPLAKPDAATLRGW